MPQRVAILAPSGRDATVSLDILASAEIEAFTCPTMSEVIDALDHQRVGALLVTEEALGEPAFTLLEEWLKRQPPWSDLPIVILTFRRDVNERRWRLYERLGNVTVLERPLHPTTLVSALRNALRARARQHVTEDHVAELARQREAVKQERDRTRSYLNVAGVILLVLNRDGVVAEINPFGVDLLGYASADQIVGQNWFDFAIPLDSRAALIENYRAVMGGRASTRLDHENAIVQRGGTERMISWRSSVIRDSEGHVAGVLSSGEDITERRSTEHRLRLSERRYETLFETMDEGFCIIEFLDTELGPNTDYIHIEANPAYERHAGIPNVVGQRLRDMVPEEADSWAARYGEVLRTGIPIRFEQELVATGRHLDLAAFRIEPPELKQVAVLFQDITERKRSQAELQRLNATLAERVSQAIAEKKLLADVVEGTDDCVEIASADYRWLAINRAAKNEINMLYGTHPAVGQPILDAFAKNPEHQAALKAMWTRALAGEAFSEVARVVGQDGTERFYEARFAGLHDASGTQIGAYQFARNITERLNDQRKLEEATARMHEMAKLETLGQLTGGVAHDFNNLLTPIVGALDILRRRHESDERSLKYIFGALQAAERAGMLVQRLLTFARRQHLEARSVDVAELVGGMRDLIDRSLGPEVQVKIVTEDDLPPATVDPNQLELAILNLAVNARDAMPNGGALTLCLSLKNTLPGAHDALQPGDYVVLSVIDTGEGMDEATLKRAVEPFFTTKELGRGTGLLSMVHGLAAQSGGMLRLTSRKGEGTVAELWLPASEAKASSAAKAANTTVKATEKLRILLVDDEDLVRSATVDMLHELGHDVVDFNVATAALAYIKSGPPVDLIITDHLMPQMRGTELIAEVKRLKPGLPVLVITGYADQNETEAANLPRLAKPFRTADLAAEIHSLFAA